MTSIELGEGKGREVTPDQEAILAERPEHDEAVELAVLAWKDLETCRPIGMVAGLIPWDAIDRWCERNDLDDGASSILIDAIRFADCEDFKARTTKAPPKGARR